MSINDTANRQLNRLTKIDFPYLELRPITEAEVERWNSLMKEFHYLGFRCLVGETMKYVAILRGQWVGLLGWGCAAFKIRSRDQWLGWNKEQQWARLKFIANNQRFLILPDFHIENLASKILSLNLRRLSQDWQTIHGHPIVLAETFVDQERFTGACYQAANWIRLGQTRGFGRNGGKYYLHGHVKTVYVYCLRTNAPTLLSASFLAPELTGGDPTMVDLNQVALEGDTGLIACLTNLVDPRKARGIRHSLISVLAIGVCAKLAGSRSFIAIGEWAAELPQSLLKRFHCRFHEDKKVFIAPSEPTIRRTLQSVDPDELDRIAGQWFAKQCDDRGIAVDGKTCRGSGHGDKKPVHLLAAFSHVQNSVLAQRAVDEKSNEITAFIPLLRPLDLKGKVVTADAMHTQKGHAEFLVKEKQADYILIVKDNQKTLLTDIKAIDESDFSPSMRNEG